MIEKDGWYLIKTRGDHRQYKHPIKPGRVTISGNLGKDMPPGTLNSVLKQFTANRLELVQLLQRCWQAS